MGQSKADRTWPSPRNTRHVWVYADQKIYPPVQGLVVSWTRRRYRWSAFVVRVETTNSGDRVIQDWVPLERLRPVRSDPNKIWRDAWFGEFLRPPVSQ